MGCNSSSPPLLADIYSSYEQKYDFEQLFPLDPSHQPMFTTVKADDPGSGQTNTLTPKPVLTNTPSTNSQLLTPTASQLIVTDDDIDINNNSGNLSAASSAHDILVDLNRKISKLLIRFTQYKGKELAPILKLGLNESKHAPPRSQIDEQSDDVPDLVMSNSRGLLTMELIISHWIRCSKVDVIRLCPRRSFPNDVKALMVSFYSLSAPKLASFRALIPTAVLCQSTLNLTQYIGAMLAQKLLFQNSGLEVVDQESIMSEDHASACRQLIFLFHYILGLDQYKMPQQQPLTNNFTAYKRMHSDIANKGSSFQGGGFSSFSQNKTRGPAHGLTDKELLPITELNNIAMFLGKGCTACIDSICEAMGVQTQSVEMSVLCQFANGCLTLLSTNGVNKRDRKPQIVRYALYILRALVAVLLMIDFKKSKESPFLTVFGNNERTVQSVACCRMISSQFARLYGDEESLRMMQGVEERAQMEYHVAYCKRILTFGASGWRNGQVKPKIENMFR